MPIALPEGSWALILGGSSGFGLATAHQLSRNGANVCIVHRDRRGAMKRIEPEFDAIRGRGASLLTFNKDALDAEVRSGILTELESALGPDGKVRVLMHSIAFGNLKLVAPEVKPEDTARARLAAELGIEEARLTETVDKLFSEGVDGLAGLTTPPTLLGLLLHRRRRPAADHPRHGDQPARLDPGAASSRHVRRGRPSLRNDERGERGRLEGLRGGIGCQGRARIGEPGHRRRDGPLRHPVEHHPGGRDRHPRAPPDSGKRASQGGRPPEEPLPATDDAGGRGEGDPPASASPRRRGSTER